MIALPVATPDPGTEVDCAVHSAAMRFGLVGKAGGRKVGPLATEPVVPGADLRSEFRDESGGIVALKVTAGGATRCWLRDDLVYDARCKLLVEQREYNNVTEQTLKWAMANPAPACAPDCQPAPLSQELVRAAFRADKRQGKLHGMGDDAQRRRAYYAAALKPPAKTEAAE